METLIEINVALFLASASILFFILKYRVRIYIEHAATARRRTATVKAPRSAVSPTPSQAPASLVSAQIVADLESALVNLGATTGEAKTRAAQAIAQGPGDFDALILRAMQAQQLTPRRARRNRDAGE